MNRQRYFFSSRLGRGICVSTLDTFAHGRVRLCFPDAPLAEVDIALDEHHCCGSALEGDAFIDHVCRIAIAQAHRAIAIAAPGTSQLCFWFDPWLMPWRGDLTEKPYGGATDGYQAFIQAHAEQARVRPSDRCGPAVAEKAGSPCLPVTQASD